MGFPFFPVTDREAVATPRQGQANAVGVRFMSQRWMPALAAGVFGDHQIPFVGPASDEAASASMTEEAFADYLKHRFDDQCGYYSRQAALNRSRYLAVQTVTIVACALSPLIAMMPEPTAAAGTASILPGPKILMAILAAVAGVCTALEKLMKFQDNWVGYREIREALRRERALFDTGVEEYAALPTEDERRRLFVVRVEAALRRESTQWVAAAANRPGGAAPATVR